MKLLKTIKTETISLSRNNVVVLRVIYGRQLGLDVYRVETNGKILNTYMSENQAINTYNKLVQCYLKMR